MLRTFRISKYLLSNTSYLIWIHFIEHVQFLGTVGNMRLFTMNTAELCHLRGQHFHNKPEITCCERYSRHSLQPCKSKAWPRTLSNFLIQICPNWTFWHTYQVRRLLNILISLPWNNFYIGLKTNICSTN